MTNPQRVNEGYTYVRGATTSVAPVQIKQTTKPVPAGLAPRVATTPRVQNVKH